MAKLPKKIKETIQQIMQRVTGIDITCCPKCQKGKMVTIKELPKLAWNTS
jgi:predicted secreted Zn-dependent protease